VVKISPLVGSKDGSVASMTLLLPSGRTEAVASGLTARGPILISEKKTGGQQVKMSSGVVGWVNMNEAKFAGVDQFASVAPDSPLLDACGLRDWREISIAFIDLQQVFA
jgi:hypothetical protein